MKIIFTIGDINGIGLEVLLKALLNNESWFDSHCFSIMENGILLKHIIDKNYNELARVNNDEIILNTEHKIKIIEIKHTDILNIGKQIKEKTLNLEIGKASNVAGIISYHSIVEATKLTVSKEFDAIVTLPISKEAIHFFLFYFF